VAISTFEHWWHEEGSGMPPKVGEDAETFARRMCEIAWKNGAFVAREESKEARRRHQETRSELREHIHQLRAVVAFYKKHIKELHDGVDCVIECGAESGEYLEFVRKQLKAIGW